MDALMLPRRTLERMSDHALISIIEIQQLCVKHLTNQIRDLNEAYAKLQKHYLLYVEEQAPPF